MAPTGASIRQAPVASVLDAAIPETGRFRLLASDVRFAFVLVNEARCRAIQAIFGVPREQANVITLFALLLGAQALADRASRVIRAPAPSSPGELLFGAASAREVLRQISGPGVGDTPLLGTLIMFAILGTAGRRLLTQALRSLRESSRRADVRFHQRYGYLIDPGNLRRRRALRHSQLDQ